MEALGADALATTAPPESHQGRLLTINEPATKRLDSPVLLVTGGADRLFTPDVAERFRARLCSLETELWQLHFDDAGHAALASLARPTVREWLEAPGPGPSVARACAG